jgi:hypothetical protein
VTPGHSRRRASIQTVILANGDRFRLPGPMSIHGMPARRQRAARGPVRVRIEGKLVRCGAPMAPTAPTAPTPPTALTAPPSPTTGPADRPQLLSAVAGG